eukprot:TRINITY_DN30928_c0_g1_i1.p1 TRINITY_DN30928_c0_g1~~TRINITY_DN30928_c0_g1_i1.p1  ORF type:complete len:434 (-),score=92.86 TRINITY_DN30928_c0_g1_i1:69-1370(-)
MPTSPTGSVASLEETSTKRAGAEQAAFDLLRRLHFATSEFRRRSKEEAEAAAQAKKEADACEVDFVSKVESLQLLRFQLAQAQQSLAKLRTFQGLETDPDLFLERAQQTIQCLSKRQLDECKALSRPPPPVVRTLSLLHCVLQPKLPLYVKSPEELSWKDTLLPMLREDLVKRMFEYPPADKLHPLVDFPATVAFLDRQVSLGLNAMTSSASTSQPQNYAIMCAPKKARKAVSLSLAGASMASNKGNLGKSQSSPNLRENQNEMRRIPSQPPSPAGGGSAALLGKGSRLTLEAANFGSHLMGIFFQWVYLQLTYFKSVQRRCQVRQTEKQIQALSSEVARLSTITEAARVAEVAARDVLEEAEARAKRCADSLQQSQEALQKAQLMAVSVEEHRYQARQDKRIHKMEEDLNWRKGQIFDALPVAKPMTGMVYR